jgi:hypothetical protein
VWRIATVGQTRLQRFLASNRLLAWQPTQPVKDQFLMFDVLYPEPVQLVTIAVPTKKIHEAQMAAAKTDALLRAGTKISVDVKGSGSSWSRQKPIVEKYVKMILERNGLIVDTGQSLVFTIEYSDQPAGSASDVAAHAQAEAVQSASSEKAGAQLKLSAKLTATGVPQPIWERTCYDSNPAGSTDSFRLPLLMQSFPSFISKDGGISLPIVTRMYVEAK